MLSTDLVHGKYGWSALSCPVLPPDDTTSRLIVFFFLALQLLLCLHSAVTCQDRGVVWGSGRPCHSTSVILELAPLAPPPYPLRHSTTFIPGVGCPSHLGGWRGDNNRWPLARKGEMGGGGDGRLRRHLRHATASEVPLPPANTPSYSCRTACETDTAHQRLHSRQVTSQRMPVLCTRTQLTSDLFNGLRCSLLPICGSGTPPSVSPHCLLPNRTTLRAVLRIDPGPVPGGRQSVAPTAAEIA